jgi:hypothetical protein
VLCFFYRWPVNKFSGHPTIGGRQDKVLELSTLMNSSIISEFRWLMSDAATAWLTAAFDEFSNNANPLKIAKQLRNSISPTRTALVMEQAQLRIRAKKKFPLAENMFFTKRGLEQSSGHEFAKYKSTYFQSLDSVADICCGVGGDLLELATRPCSENNPTSTLGVDVDAVTALFAQKNLDVHLADSPATFNSATVQETDFQSLDIAQFSGLHLDPDRRKGRRTTDGRHFSPALNEVFANVSDNQLVAVKVAPATPRPDYLPTNVHREWLGDSRECKQQMLWLNSTHRPGGRSATMIGKQGDSNSICCQDQSKFDRMVAEKLHQYLYEPRSVVLAAGLEDHLAAQHGLARIAYDIPYYTSKELIAVPLLSRFQVVDLLKLDLKLIHSFLVAHNVGQIELKQRGIDKVTYDRVRKLKIKGERKATVILTRYGESQKRRVIIAKRID